MFSILLIIHVLASIIFIGNNITGAFWKVRADKTGNLEVISSSVRALLRADYQFTLPSLVVLFVTGVWMGGITGWERFQEIWLGSSFVLLVIIALIWGIIAGPKLRALVRIAAEDAATGRLSDEYTSVSRTWSIWGGIMTLLPIIILVLMVLRPNI